jgi:hypothetical protein
MLTRINQQQNPGAGLVPFKRVVVVPAVKAKAAKKK